MATKVLRCPACIKPRYRVVGRRGWAVRADYVGYLAINFDGVKTPPKACPECQTALERIGA